MQLWSLGRATRTSKAEFSGFVTVAVALAGFWPKGDAASSVAVVQGSRL